MPSKATSLKDDPLVNEPSALGEKISDTVTRVRDKMSDMGRSAADKIDENRNAAAGGLEKAASTLHEKAESLHGGETVTNLAHATADKLSSTADYVREHDANKMMAGVEKLVKNNPGLSLLSAAVIGFLVGRAFSSND